MAELNVKATRMELQNLKKRIKIAKRGHKLLKDKRDELMKEFMALIRESGEQRKDTEDALAKAYRKIALAQGLMGVEDIRAAIAFPPELRIEGESVNKAGVEVPVFRDYHFPDLKEYQYSLVTTSSSLDEAVMSFRKALRKLLDLSAQERSIELMAGEIERTRRRVNALEHVLIPRLKEGASYIQMKLDELERANFANLMRIKDILK